MNRMSGISTERHGGEGKSEQIYQELLALIKDILAKGKRYEPIEGKEIVTKIDKAVELMTMEGDELISLTMRSTPNNYLYAHSVNVCLLSIKVGLGSGYNKSELNELGVSGLLHDIGMVKVKDITQLHRKLTKEEYESVKQHPIYGAEILEKIKDLTKAAIYVAREHHERVNGNGYPRGLSDSEINECARIVGLVDVYEALTHVRPHRDKIMSSDAIVQILKNKAKFEPQFLKVLIEQLTIYPVGNWVLLNSDEVGKVVKVNKGFPLRPIVDVMFTTKGSRLAKVKSIDLSKDPTLFIKRSLRNTELKTRTTYRRRN